MAFTPRTFVEILNDMVAYTQTRTALSDFTPGSVIRTILEAAALEDDEQYFQMVQLLDLFSINTSTGSDLDRRLADFGLFRLPARLAFGRVVFFDSVLKVGQIASDETAGSVSVILFDSSTFPISGFPYTIRIGEGGTNVQDVDVTANNTAGGILTLDAATPLVDSIAVGDRVALVDGAISKTVLAGTDVEAPATVSAPTKRYTTQEPASILAGNFFSNSVLAKATQAGALGNTGSQTITKFAGGPPFTGAGVINTTAIEGGSPVESDVEFRSRGLDQLQSLSRGTPLALKSAAVGIEDPETGQRVASANIVEDFVSEKVIVFVDDGTGLIPDLAFTGGSSVFSDPPAVPESDAGDDFLNVENGESFPSIGTILIEAEGINIAELVDYTAVNNNTISLSTALVSDHGAGAIVNGVDVITEAAEVNQRRFNLRNFPIAFGSERVFTKTSLGLWVNLVRDVDYVLNNGTGELQIVDLNGLVAGTQLVASYTFYTNLIEQVQRVLEGDLDDPLNFPGVKAAGIFLRVEAPTAVEITIRATLSAIEGFAEADLADPVRRVIENYINGRKIGEDIIVSKMIDVAHNINGVRDVRIVEPLANIVILEDQLPISFDASDGTSLVSVS